MPKGTAPIRAAFDPDAAWRLAEGLARRFRLPADPMRNGGPGRIVEVQSRSVRAREGLVRLAGTVLRELAEAELAWRVARRKRKRLASAILASAMEDPELRRAVPAVRNARITLRLAEADDVLAETEDRVEALKALKEFIDIAIEHAKAAKETLRQQVDLVRDERLEAGRPE